MALRGYFGNDDDTPITLGVEPLTSLYSGAEATGPAASTPIVRDEGDAEARRRERLAGILLGLGTFGGYQPPAFLTEELRARSRGRREEDAARRLLELKASMTEATERRKEQRAQAGRERQAEAVRGVRDEVLRVGTAAINHATQLAFRAQMLAAGVPDAIQQDIMKVWATKFEMSDDKKTMVQTWSHGLQAPKQWPLRTVEKLGNALFEMWGTEAIGKIAEQPEVMTLKPGEQPFMKPGVRLPGEPLPKELTPVGPAVPEVPKEQQLSEAHRTRLAPTMYGSARTFEELRKMEGGPEKLAQLMQDERIAEETYKEAEWNRRSREMEERITRQAEERLRVTAEAERRKPVTNISHWFKTEDFTPAFQGMSREQLEVGGYRELDAKQAETVRAAYEMRGIIERAYQIITATPEGQRGFPRSVGQAEIDQVLAQEGALFRKRYSQTENLAYLATIPGRLAGFIRASGDTRISNLDFERYVKALGIGHPEFEGSIPLIGGFTLSNANTAEAVTGRFNFFIDALNDQYRAMGFGQIPQVKLPPLEEGSTQIDGKKTTVPGRWYKVTP